MTLKLLVVKKVKQPAISYYLLHCNCTINFDDLDILASDSSIFKLLVKGSLFIKCDKPILNRTINSLIKMTVLFLLSNDCHGFFDI